MNKQILLRSFMFLPAYNRKFIGKALQGNADAIILDMEDSVPEEKRTEAREVVKEFSKEGLLQDKVTFIRINSIGSLDFVKDISELLLPGIDGLMPSKIDTAEDIVFVDRLVSFFEMKNNLPLGNLMLAPLIETTKGIANVQNIAKSSDRLVALCFGGEDYLNDIGSLYTYQETAFIMPRAAIVNAARSEGLLAIDTPFLNIPNLEEFEKKETIAYRNGFSGCLLLNPKQIEPAHRAFSPDQEKTEYSKRVIDAVKESQKLKGSSVAMLDGGMVGPPMRKKAIAVMEQNLLIKSYADKMNNRK